MAVVGIGRLILDLDRSVESAAASAEPPTTAADTSGLGAAAAVPAVAAAGTPAGEPRAAAVATESPATSSGNVNATSATAPTPGPTRSPAETPAERPASRAESPTTATGRTAEVSRAAAAADAQKPAQRFVVQLAAWKSLTQAREVGRKVEALGLRAHYQTMETGEGRRFRVRVGPFATRAEAERAQRRVASLRLSGTL